MSPTTNFGKCQHYIYTIRDLETLVIVDTWVENVHRFTERFDPGYGAHAIFAVELGYAYASSWHP